MPALLTTGYEGKDQVVDRIPKRFKELKFGIQSNQNIVNQGVLEITDKQLYDVEKGRVPVANGALDAHLDCAKVLLTSTERRAFLKDLRRPGIDNLKRTQICKKINEQCRKAKICPYCNAHNGQIRKPAALKLVHDKYQAYTKSNAKSKVEPAALTAFRSTFDEIKKTNTEVDKHLKKAMDDLNPLRVLNLFKMISPSDCELLGINPAEGRPEMFLWQYVPAPPVCIRPSVAQESASTEDDLTTKLSDIVHISSLIRAALQKGQPLQTIVEQWDYLQLQIALYINSDVPNLQQVGNGKPIRGFCQRLKGKQGRFRGNLSGKRVDFSGRTVISPDPNLGIDQVAIPILVAKNLTYPERVQDHNIKKLRKCVLNGSDVHPGAQHVIKKDKDNGEPGDTISLKFPQVRKRQSQQLTVGDVVERHLEDGDIVLFNRQPSLHKLSIMSHYVKVRPWRTFRLNECVCNPYNADFDGDEMNLHVPQTEEARTEAINLMGVKNNLSTPKNGEPIISATQDFITAAYLLSSKDNFFNRKTFTNYCMYMVDGNEHLDLPPPAILKPEALWTGKQVFSILMRPNKQSPVKVNLDAKCRDYKAKAGMCPDMDPNDGWLVVRNSEVMCGRMDKTTVGSGKKDSIFYIILRDFGPDAAVVAMNRLSKISARYLTNEGFSIGISDVYPSAKLTDRKNELVTKAYEECEDLIRKFKDGKLEKATGCNMEETLENEISGKLSIVRQLAGDYCIDTLSKHNSPLIMAKSGSKGSAINVAQMVAVVGQQIIGGQRVPDGFQDRSLPHFPKNARQPLSKGFVRNSFFTGLTPTEFLFHAISGREGLVDTAVKTAETGYMSRRLMKSLEDLSTQYDDTVRNSSGGIVQFQFGADKLDPVDMEGSAVPVHFDRTWTHAENLTWNNDDRCLLPYEIKIECEKLLATQKSKYARKGLLRQEPLEYLDQSDYAIDELESARDFVATITKYVGGLAEKLAKARMRAGLKDFAHEPKTSNQRHDKSKEETARRDQVERVAKVSQATLQMFVSFCLDKYASAHVEPGHAVGAVGAQSIGEPGTQMTLKTFHFAGVAGMSITQGVPRIKEIINASKVISTPVITCPLLNRQAEAAAKVVKGRIEKTYIGDVIRFIEDMWSAKRATMCLSVDMDLLNSMHLGITVGHMANVIIANKKLKIKNNDIQVVDDCIFVNITHESGGNMGARGPSSKKLDEPGSDLLLRVNFLRRVLPTIAISGYPDATRAIIQKDKNDEHTVLVEGYGIKACMTTEGVIGTKCTTNSVMECFQVLGIEAARTTIAKEIAVVMGDMGIDPRHMQLLADVMTYKGEVLGITRFGLSKMRDSVLQLASFEKTPDHLFDAAAGMKTDQIEGVSECIIMGLTMGVGTGGFKVVQSLEKPNQPLLVGMKTTQFEDAWKWEQTERKKLR
ncbi:DNA-directed RNA polymerase III subunit RPC1 [Lachnellula cervina]|uniref:DNA-directed RNA polymerase subunit n=1 Tax=Lachnellula cervina TaxID=1316786 RepID=A0A7D8YS48_9HELO|nr:DNA-directed RNA polymerase III subunit RPC1 [Lachnellula cervina]